MAPQKAARWLFVVGVACLLGHWYRATWPYSSLVHDLYANVATSAFSISVTVLLIDRLYQLQDDRQRKRSLVWEMGSSDGAIAARAVKELRFKGWLTSGALQNADLTKANLEQTDLNGSILTGVNFSFSTLASVDFTKAALDHARFDECDARGAIFKGANLGHTSFKKASLGQAILDDVEAAGGIDLLGASLLKASFRNAKLQGAKLESCDLVECDMSYADLSNASLSDAIVEGAVLNHANLERADLQNLQQWDKIRSITGAKIAGVRNAPPGFVAWAIAHGAVP